MRRLINLVESISLSNEEKTYRWDYLRDSCFQTNIGKYVADEIIQRAKEVSQDDWESEALDDFTINVVGPIRIYLSSLLRSAHDRQSDLKLWFNIPNLSFDQITIAAKQYYTSKLTTTSEEEEEEDEYDDEYWDKMVGYLPYSPEMDTQHFIRFGKPNKFGRSVFGLAADDNEDGPDQWRIESGNKTHEAGISVFVASRSISDPNGWVIHIPDFRNARYSPPSQASYIQSILPKPLFSKWMHDHKTPVAYWIDGSIVTSKLRKGLAAELGSDGEYLINTSKPFTSHVIPLENIYISEKERLVDWLTELDFWNRECSNDDYLNLVDWP